MWARDILFVHADINLNIGLGTKEVLVEQSPAHFDILHHVLNLSVIFPWKKKLHLSYLQTPDGFHGNGTGNEFLSLN